MSWYIAINEALRIYGMAGMAWVFYYIVKSVVSNGKDLLISLLGAVILGIVLISYSNFIGLVLCPAILVGIIAGFQKSKSEAE